MLILTISQRNNANDKKKHRYLDKRQNHVILP